MQPRYHAENVKSLSVLIKTNVAMNNIDLAN